MPLKRSLDERGTFDPKAVAILLEAFDGVVTELALREPAERERAAKLIIRLALGQANLGAAKLRDGTVAFMRKESGTCLHPVVSFDHGGLIGPPSSEKAAVWVASPVVRLRRSALDGGLFQVPRKNADDHIAVAPARAAHRLQTIEDRVR